MKRTLKSIRIDLGLTQEQIAKKLNLGVQTWRNKEAYRSELTATELLELCEMAKVDPMQVKLTN